MDAANDTGTTDGASVPTRCYGGPLGSSSYGACRSGHIDGNGWCVDQVLPTEDVAGDNVDSDCDNRVDESSPVPPSEFSLFPAVASDGERYLAAWNEGGVALAFLTADQRSPYTVPLAGASYVAWDTPSIGWNGQEYAVAYPDGGLSLALARITRTGAVIATASVAEPVCWGHTPLRWSGGPDGHWYRITTYSHDRDTGPFTLVIAEFPPNGPPRTLRIPSARAISCGQASAAWNGDGYGLAWWSASGVQFARVDADGHALSSHPMELPGGLAASAEDDLVASGDGYLYFVHGAGLARLDADGHAVSAWGPFTVPGWSTRAPIFISNVTIATDGTAWFGWIARSERQGFAWIDSAGVHSFEVEPDFGTNVFAGNLVEGPAGFGFVMQREDTRASPLHEVDFAIVDATGVRSGPIQVSFD